jgi:hypothetical protein
MKNGSITSINVVNDGNSLLLDALILFFIVDVIIISNKSGRIKRPKGRSIKVIRIW